MKEQSIFKAHKRKDVFTKKASNPFASILNTTLSDKRLSYRARGILAYLLTKPDHWKILLQDVVNNGTEGAETIRACFRELKDFGYARLVKGMQSGVVGSRWIICEDPAPEMAFSPISRDGTFPELREKGVLSKEIEEGSKKDAPQPPKGDSVSDGSKSPKSKNAIVNNPGNKATDKAAAMEALSGQADRVAQIFKRRANTPWSEKEVIAWKKLLKAGPLDDAELAMVERYYAANRRKSDSICRTSLLTFLTHFHGEIDRARSWWEKQPAAKKPKPPPPVRILDDVIEPEKAQPLPDPNEPATKVFLENYALHHEGRLPYGYAREGTKIVFVTDGQAK